MTPAGFEGARDGVRRLYCGLSPDLKVGGRFLALEAFQMFADDSYTEEVYTVGGFCGPIETWEKFSQEWFAAFKERPRLEYYTTNDALAFRGPFTGWAEEVRNLRMAKLASIIPRGNCWGVSCHLARREFEEFFTPNFLAVWNDPYYLCATYSIENVCRVMLPQQPTKLDFIFDRQGKVGRHFELVYDAFVKPVSLPIFPFMGECRHEDKREFLPLQAADMNAAWVRRRQSTIQLWTTADVHLSSIEQFDIKVKRFWLERLASYRKEHAEEIKAFWNRMTGE